MPDQEPDATPEQQAQVRRLLAEARHDRPTPPAVARRLDEALAGLVAQRAAGAPVIDLGARRRRRVVALLGAAAAVVVLGVGISQVTDLGSGDSDGGDSQRAGSAADESAADESAAAEDADPKAPGVAPQQAPPASAPTVGSGTFAADAARLRDRAALTLGEREPVDGPSLTRDPLFVCDATDAGVGRLLGVRYDDVPAILAYRPPAGDTQAVELLRCGTGEVVRTTVLRAP